MTDFDWISATGVAMASGYLTLFFVAETQPEINEYGEEEYSIPGYLFLAGAFVIKWSVKTAARIIGYCIIGNKGSVIAQIEEEEESSSFIGEHELVI